MFAVVMEATAKVLTWNVMLVFPTATVTDGGTIALVVLDASLTTTPPVGAGPSSVAVPIAVAVPFTLDGAMEILANTGGLIVSVALRLTPEKLA